jgi:hypothetical protein
MKYLYGASVQGIQGFIFETNKLQEIVGASEIVKSIEEKFLTFSNYGKENKNILLNAAGNIKALFDEKEYCENLVKSFSKHIQQEAYGITISQAVIVIDGETPTEDEFKKLDDKLKIQRNRPSIPLDMSLNIMELSPATAKPVSNKEKKGKDELLFDKASWQKREAFPQNDKFKELSDLSNGKNKIAVIHADGNGLGKLVPQLKEKLSSFSIALDKATRKAFEDAKIDNMKIREVILGGDDLTVICDANEALAFTQRYLKNFEKNTKNIKELKGLTEKLTACAGIAYTNEKYPFHYAVSLAESLCGQSKKHSNREASCVMFHNIQSSNYQTWSKFVEDELTIRNDSCSIRCDFGPYYVNKENQPLISDFLNSVGAYACDGSPISRLRNWLSELGKSKIYSENLLQRINTMLEQSNEWNCKIMDKNLENLYSGLSNDKLIIKKDGELKTPIYDILQILSVTEAK